MTCNPASQTVFSIGDSTVQCVAADSSGNQSNPAHFVVHVNGATQQLQDLTAAVRSSVSGSMGTGLLANLADAQQALSNGKTAAACGALTDFVDQVSAQAGKKLTASLAGQLVAAGTRIKAVIRCRTK